MSRNAELAAIESQIRAAIRDCVNRTSRKPWRWGGIEGYQQLKTIGAILRSLPCRKIDTDYLSVLSVWVDLALSNNLSVALDLEQAHQWLRRIADCLHYKERQKYEGRGQKERSINKNFSCGYKAHYKRNNYTEWKVPRGIKRPCFNPTLLRVGSFCLLPPALCLLNPNTLTPSKIM